MNRLKAWIRNYFGFSRTETNGFVILLPLMAVLLFSEPAVRWWFVHHPEPIEDDSARLDSLVATWKWIRATDSTATGPDHLFSFDPNLASIQDLRNLGLSEKLALRIVNYRSRGGKFKIKRDFRKIYGMDSVLADQLSPFINLPEKSNKAKPYPSQHTSLTSLKKTELFDLNKADTAQLIRIYGIGPKLSARIITYRTRLGGFVSMTQLHEVYGLDSLAIDQLKKKSYIDQAFTPRLININHADKKELTVLPYLRYNLANAIAAYRFQHGEFKSIEELMNLKVLDEPTYQKIKPYLTIKD